MTNTESIPNGKFNVNPDTSHLNKKMEIVSKEKTILVTDENVFAAAKENFNGWQTIVIKAGEENKQQSTVDNIIQQLIEKEAGRNTYVVGVGGGVVVHEGQTEDEGRMTDGDTR